LLLELLSELVTDSFLTFDYFVELRDKFVLVFSLKVVLGISAFRLNFERVAF